jgi:transmembrane sensor
MMQYDLDKLLEKYLDGTCTPTELEQVRAWWASQPNYPLPLSSRESQEVERRLWAQIRQSTQPSVFRRVSRNPWAWAGAVAASVAVCWLVATYLTRQPSFQEQPMAQAEGISDVEMRNTSGRVQALTLDDGSVVWLQPGAKLAYPMKFGPKARRVFLTGEAQFDVQRNPNRPFTVHTGPLTTEVLGTRFVVRSPEQGGAIQVAVLSGKVSVYENASSDPTRRDAAILTPNQQATFFKESGKLVPGLVEKPRVVVQKADKPVDFTYREIALSDLVQQFSTLYGLDIQVEGEALRPCTFSGDLNGITLFEQLDLICRTLNARYEIQGTHVSVRGEGCL